MYAPLLLFVTFIMFFGWSDVSQGDVDKQSVFAEAREPASELDTKMLQAQLRWGQLFRPEECEGNCTPSLIVKAAVFPEFSYFDDQIHVEAWIRNIDGFLSLNMNERRDLVEQTLDTALALLDPTLVHKKTGRPTGKITDRSRIYARFLFSDLKRNDKGESVLGLQLPNDIGFGVAGYKDGSFVFSRDYYLALRVVEGKAVAGDPTQFVVVKDK